MESLQKLLSELRPDLDFSVEEDLIGRGILDSFDVVTLIAMIDETFDVMITAEYILPEHFYSAKTIYALIEKLRDE